MKEFDTICAIATALGEGGIAIIRISGDKALDIASKIFCLLNSQTSIGFSPLLYDTTDPLSPPY